MDNFIDLDYEQTIESPNEVINTETIVSKPELKVKTLRQKREKLLTFQKKNKIILIRNLDYNFDRYDTQLSNNQARLNHLIIDKNLDYLKKKPEFCNDGKNLITWFYFYHLLLKLLYSEFVYKNKNREPCRNCKASVKYLDLNRITKDLIEEELVKHGHNKTRLNKDTNKSRNVEAARNELEYHYKYAHSW